MAFISQLERLGYGFIPPKYLPAGKDEYWIRDTQAPQDKTWRALQPGEIEKLAANNNVCPDWDKFLVCDPFDPSLIRNSYFYGLVRIGPLRDTLLQHHDFCVPAGIRNSTIISCDIGEDTAIQECSYISHYIIGKNCILSRIDEIQATNHAKFGNGVIKEGEEEKVRICIDVMNEAGGRSILPFRQMLSADAFLWACYRDDTELTERLKDITQKEYGGPRGAYGVIGCHSAIKSCRIIKDVFVGEWAYIKGANKLKNISVLSSKEEPTQIGEGVEMVNGIIGFGCNAFYGSKAVRFVMGRGSSLKYGGRLIHSVLGDNSTVSCGEMLNSLIFPAHEQHHNNSFLIASLIQGASNMAAGATVGSNHNSRANDGEIRAGRGFWPGLSVTLKHSSRFASFVFIVKGDYPYELDITLPFSLVNNNVRLDRLEIMPAYFWLYNLYALERNSWKINARDKRKIKKQHIETNYLAPDTAEEIIGALAKMEDWMKAAGMVIKETDDYDVFPNINNNNDPERSLSAEDDFLPAFGLEFRQRDTVLLKPRRSFAAYREMLFYYSLKTIANYLIEMSDLPYTDFVEKMENSAQPPAQNNTGEQNSRISEWVNLGGQIAPAFRIDELRARINRREIDNWEDIHAFYDEMAAAYPLDKTRHAWEVYRYLCQKTSSSCSGGHPFLSCDVFKKELANLILLQRKIAQQVYISRAKDFSNPFRSITFRNSEEMEAVIENAGKNPFVKIIYEQTKNWEEAARKLSERL